MPYLPCLCLVSAAFWSYRSRVVCIVNNALFVDGLKEEHF